MIILAVLLVGLPVPLFVAVDRVVYHFESRDTFCIACHLHERKYKEFTVPPGQEVSLAARHHTTNKVRCIDCHKGEGVWERLGVLTIAAWDTIIYFLGMHEEPQHMRFPLGNATCLKCHQKDLVPKGAYATKYHDLTPHANLPIRCPECHVAHPHGDPKLDFLVQARVIPICQRCHPTMFDAAALATPFPLLVTTMPRGNAPAL
ncbi:MAG: hypothetical protein D6690_13585 [Nitrospirae bacterium]|nr:MAG: hypothetical protein D6690_13585 [Nitrospirota bacterium]